MKINKKLVLVAFLALVVALGADKSMSWFGLKKRILNVIHRKRRSSWKILSGIRC